MSTESSPSLSNQKPVARRGRPRKHPLNDLKPSPKTLFHSPTPEESQAPVQQQQEEQQPREERSYKDFFPDLDIKEPLPLLSKQEPSLPPIVVPSTAVLPIPRFQKQSVLKQQQRRQTKQQQQPEEEHEKESKDAEDGSDLDSHSFHRPKNHYIRYIEPSEKELFEMIEYDMDEQDEAWLKIYNRERKKEGTGQVTCELFEAIIDKLEKEWFNLVKNLPKKTAEEPLLPEDSKCAVCDDGECENSNAIVFCDGCNLAVHQDCYGIPYIPEGQWLCRKCMISPENPVSCMFCPFEGGAFKQTTTNQWAHLLCAIWIPEVTLSNSVYMEPIDNMALIPKSRWKLTCYICRRRRHHSACIQCDNKHCFLAFHVTCARWARLCMRMKLLHSSDHHDDADLNSNHDNDSTTTATTTANGVILKAYCDRHAPRDYKEQVDVEGMVAKAQTWFTNPDHKRIMPRKRYVDEEDDDHEEEGTKAARAHQHQYTAAGSRAAPIAPEYIIQRLETMPCLSRMKKKTALIESICRYWSLKRESRRGAPLLKRLHLEPWTASASQLKQTEVEKAHKASSMMSLRADLEKVRMLSEQVQKRERQKLERIRKQKSYIERILYPHERILEGVLERLMEADKRDFFRYPVTPELAPDYSEIIERPMSFNVVQDKLTMHRYMTMDEFEADVRLIWKNSMVYNQPDTAYYKLALKLDKWTDDLMVQAERDREELKVVPETGLLDVTIDREIFTYGEEKDKEQESFDEEQQQIDVAISSPENSNSSVGKKRAASVDDDEDEGRKRRRKEKTKKKAIRVVTRSMTERNKRELRSRKVLKSGTSSSSASPSSNKKKKKRSRTTSSSPSTTTVKEEEENEAVVAERQLELKDGEIVWARVRGFPPHPATIVDPTVTNKKVPEKVRSLKPRHQILVQFFLVNESHTWGWIDKSEIHALGNLETDIDMLSQAKKSKKSYRIREVKQGYNYVCSSLLHIDPQRALTQVFRKK
ncbi:MAG: hypothetical protein EXX96DRAFT_562637 [Benjaminiella poitrasii]|nr:MAG: hypothetical protein EXX96DRAFT_562637 [Benjaminiella poitrasii]